MSELQVNMQLPSSSAKFNTDGRTDERTKKLVTEVESLSVVDARRAHDRLATIGEIIDHGVLRTADRHPVIRSGEREPIPSHTRNAVWWRDRGWCELCGDKTQVEGEWELDHIIPWSAGGSDDTTNLRVLCATHNQQRSNHVDPFERPRMAATWWCSRCYSRAWVERDGLPICPTHVSEDWTEASLGMGVPAKCRVMSTYLRARGAGEEMPTWHHMPRIEATWAMAYCAHCKSPGLTDRPL